MCYDIVMEENLRCDWILLYSQWFKRWVNTILDITSFDSFSLDIPKELEIFLIPRCPVLGVGLKLSTWSHQMIFPHGQMFFAYFSEDYARFIFCNHSLLILDLVITYLCCFTLIFIFIWLILYNLPHDIFILMSLLDSIKYIIMNAEILMIKKCSFSFLRYSN